MVESTGSDDIGGVNQSGDNDFNDSGFWFEWIEFTNNAGNLTQAGFDISDGSISPGTTIYNAGSTNDLDGLATDPSASILGDDVTGDHASFGIRVTTTLTVTNDGTYTFDVRSDDGVILFVDGVQVVTDDSLHAPRNRDGDIDLTAGEHEIVIIYFERTGQNVLKVDIQSDAGGDYPTQVRLQDADVSANAGNDIVNANGGDDSVDGGAGNDTIDGGLGDDILTGGDGDDVFIVSADADTITDFNFGNSGPIIDGDQTNNDFVDLAGFYNATTLDAVNNADADPSNDFATALGLLRADAADGIIDGIIDGVDYSAQIGDIDLTLLNGGTPVTATDLTFDNTNVACFTRGTMIETINGAYAIECLEVGAMVLTALGDYQPIRWIGNRKYDSIDLLSDSKLRPIRISVGALGNNIPFEDLLVSPQHRVLIRSVIAERMFGVPEVLIAAKKLLDIDGIEIAEDVSAVEYFHFMFEKHEIVLSNGTPTESMFAGQEAMKALTAAARTELFTIFPELSDSSFTPQPAVLIPAGHHQRALVARHKKNQKPLIS